MKINIIACLSIALICDAHAMLETKRRKIAETQETQHNSSARFSSEHDARFDKLLGHWSNHPDRSAVAGVVAQSLSNYDFLKKIGSDFKRKGLEDATYQALTTKLLYKNIRLGSWLFPHANPQTYSLEFDKENALLDARESVDGESIGLAIKQDTAMVLCQSYNTKTSELKSIMECEFHDGDDIYISPDALQCCIVDAQGGLFHTSSQSENVDKIELDDNYFSSDMIFSFVDFSGDESTLCVTLSAEQEDTDDGAFSVYAYDTARKHGDWLFAHQPHGGSVLKTCVSKLGRFFAAVTLSSQKEFKQCNKSHHIIHLFDRFTGKKHTMHGSKKNKVPFRCTDICFSNDEKKLYLIRGLRYLYSIDLEHNLPEQITIDKPNDTAKTTLVAEFHDMVNIRSRADDLIVQSKNNTFSYVMRPKADSMIVIAGLNGQNPQNMIATKNGIEFKQGSSELRYQNFSKAQKALNLMSQLTPEQLAFVTCMFKKSIDADSQTTSGTVTINELLDTPDMQRLFDSLPDTIQKSLSKKVFAQMR